MSRAACGSHCPHLSDTTCLQIDGVPLSLTFRMTSRSGTRNSPRTISIGRFHIGAGQPLVLFAGPCVIESESHALSMAERLVKITAAAKMPFVFKASYDKANRS